MNTESLSDLGFDWEKVWTMLQTTGVEFGINIITAIVVFFVGLGLYLTLSKRARAKAAGPST